MSEDVLKVQDLVAKKGEKVRGYLRISEKPAGAHKIPIMLVNGVGDGPTMVVNGDCTVRSTMDPQAATQL